MRRYLKYLVTGIVSVTFFRLFLREEAEEASAWRDYAEITQAGVLRVVTEYDAVSFHAEGDSATGFHYELLDAFARDKGLTLEITPEMSLAKRLEGLYEGRYDVLAGSTVVTGTPRDSLLFTRPILLSRQMLVQRKLEEGNDSLYVRSQLDLAHKTLHVVESSPALLRIRHLGNEIGDTIYIREIKRYGQEQLLAMVAHGDIDYAVCDESIANALKDSFPQLDMSMAVGFPQFYSWAVNKYSPALADSLNAWLDNHVRTAAFKRLHKKYFK